MQEFDIREAVVSDIGGILSIHRVSFEHIYARLWRLMYQDGPSDPLHWAVENILNIHLNSQDCRFMVAYDVGELDDDLTFGLISLSVVRSAAARDTYTTSDLRTFGCLRVLERALPVGETQLDTTDPRVRLLCELQNQTVRGQNLCLRYPYLVVNTLLLWPECNNVEIADMTRRLLMWAKNVAERDGLPIWTQIPVNEKTLFRLHGFQEVRTFTLDLNHYRPHGSRGNWGTQKWVQMVYFCQNGSRGTSGRP